MTWPSSPASLTNPLLCMTLLAADAITISPEALTVVSTVTAGLAGAVAVIFWQLNKSKDERAEDIKKVLAEKIVGDKALQDTFQAVASQQAVTFAASLKANEDRHDAREDKQTQAIMECLEKLIKEEMPRIVREEIMRHAVSGSVTRSKGIGGGNN